MSVKNKEAPATDPFLTRMVHTALEIPEAAWASLQSKRLFLLSAVPLVLGVIAYLISLVVFISYRHELAQMAFGSLQGMLASLASWAMVVVSFLLAALTAFVAMNALGVFFFERLAREGFIDAGLFTREQMNEERAGMFGTVRLIFSEGLRLFLVIFLFTAAALTLPFPGLNLIGMAIFVFLFGYEFVDLSLTVRGVSFWRKLGLILKNFWEVIALGGAFAFLATIPFGVVLFYPAGCYGAARVVAKWEIPAGKGRG